MANPDMEGPFSFTAEGIDRNVSRVSPGNYFLGYTNDEARFIVRYVGRSDGNLNQELKKRLEAKYKEFKYSYAESPQVAFRKECRDYHNFGEKIYLDNDRHPDRPDDSDPGCPVCGE